MVQIEEKFPILEKEVQKLADDCEKIGQPLTEDQIKLIKMSIADRGAAAGMDTAVFTESLDFLAEEENNG